MSKATQRGDESDYDFFLRSHTDMELLAFYVLGHDMVWQWDAETIAAKVLVGRGWRRDYRYTSGWKEIA